MARSSRSYQRLNGGDLLVWVRTRELPTHSNDSASGRWAVPCPRARRASGATAGRVIRKARGNAAREDREAGCGEGNADRSEHAKAHLDRCAHPGVVGHVHLQAAVMHRDDACERENDGDQR